MTVELPDVPCSADSEPDVLAPEPHPHPAVSWVDSPCRTAEGGVEAVV